MLKKTKAVTTNQNLRNRDVGNEEKARKNDNSSLNSKSYNSINSRISGRMTLNSPSRVSLENTSAESSRKLLTTIIHWSLIEALSKWKITCWLSDRSSWRQSMVCIWKTTLITFWPCGICRGSISVTCRSPTTRRSKRRFKFIWCHLTSCPSASSLITTLGVEILNHRSWRLSSRRPIFHRKR